MTTTTLRLPGRIERLPQLRQIMRGGLAARGSIGAGLAAKAGGAAAFVGAYDAIPNIVAAYGMRRLLSSYSGSLLRIRRSDSAEQDIGYLGNGDLDTASVASFVGAGSGYIRSWYDQSGSGHTLQQATAGYQPLYVASGQNGRPVVQGNGINTSITSVFAISQPVTLFIAGHVPTNPSGWQTLTDGGTYGTMQLIWTGALYAFAGAFGLFGTSPSVPFLLNVKFNGASSSLIVNGTETTGNAGTEAPGGLALFSRSNRNDPIAGKIFEVVFSNAALSAGDRQAEAAAANTYWAIY